MLYSNFVMVERNEGARSRFFVIYSKEPHFCIEVDPSYNPAGKLGHGFIKSIRIKNSWTGDYHRCLSLAKEAEQFFRQSLQEKDLRR
jgi:hypothetical protein